MQELVGYCKACGKPVYCNEGFLNGVVAEDKTAICFDCFEADDEVKTDNMGRMDFMDRGKISQKEDEDKGESQ